MTDTATPAMTTDQALAAIASASAVLAQARIQPVTSLQALVTAANLPALSAAMTALVPLFTPGSPDATVWKNTAAVLNGVPTLVSNRLTADTALAASATASS